MKRVVRWLRNGLLGLATIVGLVAFVVYVLSERTLRRTYADPGTPVAVPSDAKSILEGERLARIRGCTGCHGSKLEGSVFIDEPLLGRIVSPNLTISVNEYSDAELERIIRHGIRPGGRSVIAMPSDMFSSLNDADVGRIIAYLRSAPSVPGHQREMRPGPLGRLGLALGEFVPAAVEVRRAATLSDSFPPAGDAMADGAYLARTVCTECHGPGLRGGGGTPDLRIAAGYSLEAFTRLMRTGKALGDREVGLMSKVARRRFSHFSDAEIQALHRYLVSRASVATTRVAEP